MTSQKYCRLMPFGYLITTGLMAVFVLFAVAPPRPRRSSPMRLSFWLGFIVNELPFVAFYVLAASTALAIGQGDIANPVGWIGLGLAVLATAGLVVVVLRAMQDGRSGRRRARSQLGCPLAHRADCHSGSSSGRSRCRTRESSESPNIAYGDAGRANLLDVYRSRSHSGTGPTLVHLHGGGFASARRVVRRGRSSIGSLAAGGSASVRTTDCARRTPSRSPTEERARLGSRTRGRVRRRSECRLRGRQLGRWAPRFDGCSDRKRCFGHRSRLAVRLLRPSRARASSPMAYDGRDAPPFFVAHPDRDTLVVVEDARRFVETLRRGSANPVVYAELPGAQHGFDFFYSIRFEAVIDGIEAFADGVLRPTSSLRRPPTAPDPVTGSSGSPGRGRATRDETGSAARSEGRAASPSR